MPKNPLQKKSLILNVISPDFAAIMYQLSLVREAWRSLALNDKDLIQIAPPKKDRKSQAFTYYHLITGMM